MRTSLQPLLLHEMALFARVVEAGSFSAAAREVGGTPSAVSRSVARLESAVGAQLLQRTTRKLGVTPEGAEVLAHCTDILNASRAVMEAGGQHGPEPKGLLRVCAPKAIGHALLHPHMGEFLRMHPKVDVHLLLDDRPLDLVEHRLDVAVRITDTPPVGLIGRRMTAIEHLVCASPAYLAGHAEPLHPKELAAHSCISLGETPGDARWKFMHRTRDEAHVVHVRGRYTANHTGVRLGAVLSGLGIGSLPEFTARAALASGDAVVVLPDWRFVTVYTGSLWALYLPHRQLPPKVRAFASFMGQKLAA
ncbi:MAG: LysR family transcriptional regulator [Pseudomonadota bacterium]|nr:LysR family transcriptional regulator [Pseudomonadota bacterium]